uniref:Uncharacterized protein n=1 Tax=viral metagenome TaxID=1070528 RepID=A0A6C0I8G7_9ZZZZ
MQTIQHARSKVSMLLIITAFVLSIMVIQTRNVCLSTKDPDTFKSKVHPMYIIAILIVVFAVLLFGYDLAVFFGYIH